MKTSPEPYRARKRNPRTHFSRGACLSAVILFAAVVFAQSRVQSSIAQSIGARSTTTSGQSQKSGSQPGNSSLVRDAATLLEAGKLEEAEAVARRAVAGQPRNTAARSVLGAILDQRGRAKEAENEYREALRLDANSAVALTNLGVLLVRTGRADEAVTTFERVLRLPPGHAQADVQPRRALHCPQGICSRDSAARAGGGQYRRRRETVNLQRRGPDRDARRMPTRTRVAPKMPRGFLIKWSAAPVTIRASCLRLA